LLEALCKRLKQEGKGIRTAVFKCYRIDGKIEKIAIGTIRASHHVQHLFRLFELKIAFIEPALGIELFILQGYESRRSFTAAGKNMEQRSWLV
jgi:protein ImuB